MQINETKLKGAFVITPEPLGDARGFFMEVYRADKFAEHGIPTDFPQCNQSRSVNGVLRGLHFQYEPKVSKLIRVVRGKAFVVAADIRQGSETFGQWVGEELSEENKKMLYAPAGFAAGFCVTGDEAQVEYHCSAIYNPKGEANILWSDPTLAIAWPTSSPSLSQRDATAPTLADWLARPESSLF